jgi:hypothetical protein
MPVGCTDKVVFDVREELATDNGCGWTKGQGNGVLALA